MEEIMIQKEDALGYMSDRLNSHKLSIQKVSNARYHHNSSYKNAPSIIKHGILSLNKINNIGIENYTEEFLKIMGDTSSHVNGIHEISLAVVGLKDLYRDEDEYDPFDVDTVDFLISSDIKASRNSINYGNEFTCKEKIPVEAIKSVDVRLGNDISHNLTINQTNVDVIRSLINKYNLLREIAILLENANLGIPLRDMSSEDEVSLNIKAFASDPFLKIK